jgi:hypothetical protein
MEVFVMKAIMKTALCGILGLLIISSSCYSDNKSQSTTNRLIGKWKVYSTSSPLTMFTINFGSGVEFRTDGYVYNDGGHRNRYPYKVDNGKIIFDTGIVARIQTYNYEVDAEKLKLIEEGGITILLRRAN